MKLGATSVFPGVRVFCSFAAVAILAVYAFQLTFFAACLALTATREAQNRHCITLRRMPRKSTFQPFKLSL